MDLYRRVRNVAAWRKTSPLPPFLAQLNFDIRLQIYREVFFADGHIFHVHPTKHEKDRPLSHFLCETPTNGDLVREIDPGDLRRWGNGIWDGVHTDCTRVLLAKTENDEKGVFKLGKRKAPMRKDHHFALLFTCRLMLAFPNLE
jgi:hypothetical protein